MFEVSEKATEMVQEFFKSKDAVSPLRIFVTGVSCKGPSLGLALDEANEEDEVFEKGGFTYVIEKQLLDQAKPIVLDYITNDMGAGFIITSNLINKNSTCGGGCSSC